MYKKSMVIAATLLAVGTGTAAQAETLKFAFQGSLNGLDPYSLNETFTLSSLGNTYEGLTRRGADLAIEPALAESWEIVEPNRWRFHLRKGVKFHNGNDFTAEDVAFSVDRVRSEGSDLSTRVDPEVKVEIVDDHTVDFVLPGPNPILHYEWDTFYIMDKDWTTENEAVKVTSASDTTPNYASLHANGTGPFKINSHEAGVKTVYEKFDAGGMKPSTTSTRLSSHRFLQMQLASPRFFPANWTWFIPSRFRTSNASTTVRALLR